MRAPSPTIPFCLSLLVFFLFLLGSVAAPENSDDFVEVKKLDPTIVVDLPYATRNNFCKKKLYPIERCFLRREVAKKLVEAHRSLKEHGYGIKIWDGYRPHSVQYEMWRLSPSPGYVGDPKLGSKHNRGAAVDVTLVELRTGNELDMPTPYDEFTVRAHANYIKVRPEVAKNRKLLQDTMRAHGFMTIPSEWWHFDYREWRKFPLADISLPDLVKQAAGTDANAEDSKKTDGARQEGSPNP